MERTWRGFRFPTAAFLLAAATIALFWPITGYEFLDYDDSAYVKGNPHVVTGLSLSNIRWALTATDASNWHPLTWISHQADAQLFGLDPGAHHLVSLMLHATAAVLLLAALVSMTGDLWPALLVAFLFAVHPLHVESVAWLAERKDVLSGCFWMLTLLAYIGYLRRPGAGRYLLLLALFTLGLMAKPMLVTLPFVLLLLDGWPLNRWRPVPGQGGGHPWPLNRWPLGRWGASKVRGCGRPWPSGITGMGEPRQAWLSAAGRLTLEKAPLFVLSVASAVITYIAQKSGGSVIQMEALPFPARLSNAIVSYAAYIKMIVWPAGLAAYYPHPVVGPPPWILLGLSALLAVVTFLALRRSRRRPYLVTGWLWYLGVLVPVIGLVQVGGQAMADRYTYLPSIGLFLAAAWGMKDLAARYRRGAPLAVAVSCLAVVVCLPLARIQMGYWKDSYSLYARTLAVTSENWMAEDGFGKALKARGRFKEAEAHFRESIRIAPDFGKAYNNLGVTLAKQGKYQEAMEQFGEALRLVPDNAEVHENLANMLLLQFRVEEAIDHFAAALRFGNGTAEGQYRLGNMLARRGRETEAAERYREALRLRPGFAEAHYNLAVILAGRGETAEAAAHYREVLRIQPGMVEAWINLGKALAVEGEVAGALDAFTEAVRLEPGRAEARYNLGLAMALQGRRGEAAAELEEALRLRPDFEQALRDLAVIRGEEKP